eukprot:m.193552 g.193552  ORF g.193552 m.193552 type:complete len:380 (-) comp14881_c0_seq7:999-2138(-)
MLQVPFVRTHWNFPFDLFVSSVVPLRCFNFFRHPTSSASHDTVPFNFFEHVVFLLPLPPPLAAAASSFETTMWLLHLCLHLLICWCLINLSGFGFLRFASQRDQQRCLDEMNQQPGCDSDKLSVSFAYPTKGQGRQPGVRQPQGQHQPRPRRHAPHAGPQAGQPTFNIINLGHGQIPEQLALQLAALNQAGRLGNVVTVGAMPGVDYQPQMMGGPMYPGQPRQMMRQRMAPMPHPWQAQHTQMGSFSVPPSTPSGPSAWSSTWTGAPYQQQALPMQRQSGMVPSQSSNAFSMGELDAALDESPNPQLYDPVTGGFGDVPSSDTQDAVGGDSRFDPSPFGRFDLGGGSGRRQHLATMSSHSYDMAPLGGPSLADDFNPMF